MKLKGPKALNEIFVPIDSTLYIPCTTLKCLKPRVLHLVNRGSLFFFTGAPKNSFLLKTLKTLFRLSTALLDL